MSARVRSFAVPVLIFVVGVAATWAFLSLRFAHGDAFDAGPSLVDAGPVVDVAPASAPVSPDPIAAPGESLDLAKAVWPSPRIFGVVGYHLWFLGFLFMFSLLALPFFQWVRRGAGQRIISWLVQVCRHRGGILVFALPPLISRLGLQPFFPNEHDWADFFLLLSFFVVGYLVISDERLRQAVRRDWSITLTVGTLAFLGAAAISFSTGELDIESAPRHLLDFAWWGLFAVCGWSWTAFTLSIGMRFLNFSNRLLRYGQEAIVPF